MSYYNGMTIDEIADASMFEEEEHSRFNFEHYKNCKDCYDDHLDFIEDQRMDMEFDIAIEAANNED